MLILNCDFDKNPVTNGAEIIRRTLEGIPHKMDTKIYNVYEGDFPDENRIDVYSHVIITGSRVAVYDDYSWLRRLKKLILLIDKAVIPTLGICLGAQIVAEVFGGRVAYSGKFTEGFRGITLTEGGRRSILFWNLKPGSKVYESHEDDILDTPEGSITLASGGNLVEAYRLRNFYCVQFHPEIVAETAIVMARRDGRDLPSILDGVSHNYRETAKILVNFTKVHSL